MALYSTVQQARAGIKNYWKMQEPSGTAALDTVGANPGTYSGGFTLGQPGAFIAGGDTAPSVLFNGTSGLMTVADAPALDYAAPLSIEGLVRPTSLASDRTLASKETIGLGSGWSIIVLATGAIQVYIGASGITSAVGVVKPNVWSHVGFTYDPTGTKLRVYVNGVMVIDQPGMVGFVTDTAALVFGGGLGQFFPGYLQKWSAYNRVLSPREFQIDAAIMALSFPPMVLDRSLQLNAGLIEHRTPVADADYTMKTTDRLVAYTSLTAARTVTLLDATAVPNQAFVVKDEAFAATAHPITLLPVLSQKIDNQTSLQIAVNGGVMRFYSNGANWMVI